MTWSWQDQEWPKFRYDSGISGRLEPDFLMKAGMSFGAQLHFSPEGQKQLIVDVLCDEAFKTSEIEGEYLNRESLQLSMCQNFGLLKPGEYKIPPPEQGISAMMFDLYGTFADPLTHEQLFQWQRDLMRGRWDIRDVGCYRTHVEPMQIVSGYIDRPKIHFEAPPSLQVPQMMEDFVVWFNDTAPNGPKSLPPLVRSSLAHLYFVLIHPFEDGNGRIARALSEKVLSQALGKPTLIAISHTIQKNRKLYYQHLENNNQSLNVSDWVEYFARTIIQAQSRAEEVVEFLIKKYKFTDRFKDKLNPRQQRVVSRILDEGVDGFRGVFNAEKYIKIAKTSRATATRDLHELVEMGVFTRTGELKGAKYFLVL